MPDLFSSDVSYGHFIVLLHFLVEFVEHFHLDEKNEGSFFSRIEEVVRH